jgi:hypothetical protein
MGVYLNPGNCEFAEIVSGKYIDKTGMIELINGRIGTPDKLVCVSRPRRFGKSYAAKMICAYYDYTCDSHRLFSGLNISNRESFEKHINRYNVINLDMAQMIEEASGANIVSYVKTNLIEEIKNQYPEVSIDISFSKTLVNMVEASGKKVVMVIDEWDAPIREKPQYQDEYLKFLRTLFKSSTTTAKIFAAAYMTGILPIKKDGSESAVSDFDEYTILEPEEFARYTGFTESEVQVLCADEGIDFNLMKRWYDGYRVGDGESVYNPYSVMKAIGGKFKSYWRKTSAAENLSTYININQYGINEEVVKLAAGESIKVDITTFNNDFTSFTCKDDVLTLMIHLGYLTYNEETSEAWIPNDEVRLEYRTLVKKPGNSSLASLIKASEKLLNDTLACNGDEVARAIEKVRETNYAPQYYNNEQALRYCIKFAYIVCVDRFLRIEELPSGRGLADVVFIPKQDTAYPAIIIELKWDKDEEHAISQIDEKKYAAVLSGYDGDIVKVGINYDSEKKIHSCRIDRIKR